MTEDVPVPLRAFIAEHIGSILQLELLLLLAAKPDEAWSSERAAKTLYVTPNVAFGLLEGMRTRGLLTLAADGTYQFQPTPPEWKGLVEQLAELYRDRRLTVTGLIYSGPDEKLRNFADAFRFRRPKEGS